MRIGVLDGFRGFFLIFMMIVHANGVLDAALGKLNHHYFGWVEDAQGFVFISGFVVALVYGGQYLRKGEAAMRHAIWSRIGTIYAYHAVLILLMAAVALAFVPYGSDGILSPYQQEPVLFTLASLFLLTGSSHMGILPMYIIFMSVTPFVFMMLRSGHYVSLFMISACLWMLAQTGLTDVLSLYAEAALARSGHMIDLGIFFNVLGWQPVFLAGLVLGYLAADKRLPLEVLKRRDCTHAAMIGIGAAVFLGIYDRIAFDHWFGMSFSTWILSQTDRGNFSIIYLVAFALDLFVIAWLMVAGQESGIRIFAALSRFMNRFFTRPALVFLGQHSLQVFAAHIALVYALELAFAGEKPGALLANLLILLSPLPLYAVAWAHAWSIEHAKRTGEGWAEMVGRFVFPSFRRKPEPIGVA